MPLEDLISSTINLDTVRSTRPGFGTPMILALVGEVPAAFTERARTYTGNDILGDLKTDGFATTDKVYKAAQVMLAQTPRPGTIIVGRRVAPVAMVYDVNIDAVEDGTYTVTINGVAFNFVAVTSTALLIRDGLISAINGGSEPVTAAIGDADTLTVTADNAGEPFTLAVTHSVTPANISAAQTTANTGVQDDLTAVQAVNDAWYMFLETTRLAYNIKEAAAWTESKSKVFMAQADEADIIVTGSTDLLSVLMGLGYIRTAFVWHDDDTEYADGAIMGRVLPEDPGSVNWAWTEIKSVPADTLTSANVTQLKAKRGNWVEKIGSKTGFFEGITPSGNYLDVVRGRDWIEENMKLDFADALFSADKIGQTQEGLELLGGIVESRLLKAAAQNIVDKSTIVVDVPKLADIPAGDISTRNASGITWRATLTGAWNRVPITGTLAIPA